MNKNKVHMVSWEPNFRAFCGEKEFTPTGARCRWVNVANYSDERAWNYSRTYGDGSYVCPECLASPRLSLYRLAQTDLE